MTKINNTSKQQPEGSPPHFTFNELEAFIGRLLVHTECNGDMCGLAERCVLRSIVTLAEMVYTVPMVKITVR